MGHIQCGGRGGMFLTGGVLAMSLMSNTSVMGTVWVSSPVVTYHYGVEASYGGMQRLGAENNHIDTAAPYKAGGDV